MFLFDDRCLRKELKESQELVRKQEKIIEKNSEELDFLREAIKPYVRYSLKHDHHCHVLSSYYSTDWNLKPDEEVVSNLKQCISNYELHISKLELYIAVLEGELGPEKTESAKNKTEALKELKYQEAKK